MVGLTDIVFSWPLQDIFNVDLYKDKVEMIPESFRSVDHYFDSFRCPLLEETRAQVQSSMETIDSAPFAQVVGFKQSNLDGTKHYKIKVDYWRNRFGDCGKEPYRTLLGDLLVLADAKPDTVSDLQLTRRSWTFVSITAVYDKLSTVSKNEEKDEDEPTSLHFRVESSKEFIVDNSSSLYIVFLVNLIPSVRIWNALNMCRNLKIINQVLRIQSVAPDNIFCEKINDLKYMGLDESLLSGLNDAQTRAVLSCLRMMHSGAKSSLELIWGPPGTGKTKTIVTLLFILMRMNCRTIICAPTNVAITEVAIRILKMVLDVNSNALFCPLGEILLVGNKERLKLQVGSHIEEIYLDNRIEKLVECLGSQNGLMHCFSSMISFLEDCVTDYHKFLENELTLGKEEYSFDEKKEECRSVSELVNRKCKPFHEYFRDRFVSIALPLRHCISVICTHISGISVAEQIKDLVSLVLLLDSFEILLFEGDTILEALEDLFSCSEVGSDMDKFTDNSILLYSKKRECISALLTLRDSLGVFPDFRNEKAVKELCFQNASFILCTASSSYMLHRQEIEPFTILVIDEAAQLRECESTIPLQLPGVNHVVLVGDECQLPAIVESNVSQQAGFGRSLFERLSKMGHSKHLLNVQYRMHPSISSFPSSNFYNNLILDAPNVQGKYHQKQYLPGSMFGPYSFINVIDGREEKGEDGRSRKNMVEVAIVSKILRNLYKEWMDSEEKLSVGVVSPYAAQVVAIKDKVGHKYDNLDGFKVKIKTVDGFQGGEEDIIIMSTVRSNSHNPLQFISNPQRVNVALTRASHCLWILGDERTLCDSQSIWKVLVSDAKMRQCFFNADQDKDMANAIVKVKKELDQFDDLLSADGVLFRSARWKVVFSDNFLKSFEKLTSVSLKKSVLNCLLKLSSGWRPKKRNVETICGSSSSLILKKFKVDRLYIICTTDIAKDLGYRQILKIWDILPLEEIQKFQLRLETILKRYTDDFIKLCMEKCLDGDMEVPQKWPASLEFSRFKDFSTIETQSDVVGDTSDDDRTYVENSQVNESFLLMKFYSLSFDVVSHLLSDHEGRELNLPFEVTDEEMEIILYDRSSFIVGRSGTGKTTILTMKLIRKEQLYQFAMQGGYSVPNSAANKGKVLRQLFVTVSPKLCFVIKQHVLHLKSFACGCNSTERSSIDMVDFDEDATQFKDFQDSFHNIPPSSYPLVITFHDFLMMLDRTLSSSYFDRFITATPTLGHPCRTGSFALPTFMRAKEVTYHRFSSSYWPRFSTQITRKLDVSRVFTEIISHIKGGLGAIDACDGKLSREDYVQLSEARISSLSKQKREAIYDIFQVYEKMKMENGEYDQADFVIDLHRRLGHEKYNGPQMEFVYIDEVQDLTMSQIALFKHVCNNVEEGFVFSGDTAQTIARGIDFRFQDIRNLFYKKFVMESRSNDHDGRKQKGQISEIRQLTQNFRTHAGILKLSQSIVDLIYRFFPHSVDPLKPETSLVYGEAPVLLESGENDNALMKIFGSSGDIVGFGAEQVILVRDDGARKEISKFVGKHALVLTIFECKGLEFQDILLYNFFGSSPLHNQWRVIYEFMKEQDLFDSTLLKASQGFSEEKHNLLCSELKQLYVAVTRTRQRLWICENIEDLSKPMFDFWKKKCLVQVRQLDDSLAQAMRVASSPEEWKSRGIKLYHEQNYEMATMCFERAGDTYWERRSKASSLKAIADRMRTSNHEEARSIVREAAEIFDAIGKADYAASCLSDFGEYERAAKIYLDKCGKLDRAAECFSLAGCYKEAANLYSRGNFFSECLTVCARGNLFEIGLQYISYWKTHTVKGCALASRGEEIDRIEQDFLESCAIHYHKLRDNTSMVNFVKASQSLFFMRNFLKGLGSLDELLVLEDEFGNYSEAVNIAQLKGEILLESRYLGKAGKFRKASTHILLYVLANSLWSSGNKGWPIRKFPQQEELLKEAMSLARNETDNFYELVCTEVDILLNVEDSLSVLKNQMNASQRHKSPGGEILSARKILDAHFSQRTDKYLWEKELIGDLVKHSEDMASKNQVSIDSLVYFWNVWKQKIIHMIEYMGCLETHDVNKNKTYQKFCLDYLGVWRVIHHINPVYLILLPDADWVRDVDQCYFRNHGKLVSIDVHQLVSAAQKYWSSELLSVGIGVLEKFNALFMVSYKSSDSTFFQSKAFALMYDVAIYLLNSKCLTRTFEDAKALRKYVSSSTERFFSHMFPLDWRKSLTANMISLRRTDSSKNVLSQIIIDLTSSNNELTHEQIGKIVVIILVSDKLKCDVREKLEMKLQGNEWMERWRTFLRTCAIGGPGNFPPAWSAFNSLDEAFIGSFNLYANWRTVKDYISPGCFIYLVEHIMTWATYFQGYIITTRSCFTEWLMCQVQDIGSSYVVNVVPPSIERVLDYVIHVVRIFFSCQWTSKLDTIQWIKKSNADWSKCYSLLVLRLFVLACLIHVTFGHREGTDVLFDLLGRRDVTEHLPHDFYDTLSRGRRHNSLGLNVCVLATALKKIDNTMIIASLGIDCTRFKCADAIFLDLRAIRSKDEILRKMFPKPPVIQVAQGQTRGGIHSAASYVKKTDVASEKCGEDTEISISNESTPESAKPGGASESTSTSSASSSASATQGKKKGNPKKHKGKRGRK